MDQQGAVLKQKISVRSIRSAIVLVILMTAVFGLAWFMKSAVSSHGDTVLLVQGPGNSMEQFEFGAWPALADEDFFSKVREDFTRDKKDFIEADLSRMQLIVYREGVAIETVPIQSKGKVGSWWETPAGLYKVEGKSETAYSSFGDVYMPWSMAFQGNFIIHGWPYHKDGSPVARGFSGGCIRLETEDAKRIYDLVVAGTPVLVFEDDFKSDEFRGEIAKPDLEAKAYLAADLKSNFVFLGKDSSTPLPIASLTKLITAAVAIEYMNIEKKIEITASMLASTTKPRLHEGDTYSVYDLLFPLLTESSNEAAEALARPLGSKRFLTLMENKAVAVGMQHAAFLDPSGMNWENIASAEDLFHLGKFLYHNRSFILKITTGRLKDSLYGPPAFNNLQNFNLFGDDPRFVGGKTGKSEAAEETMFAIFELPVNGVVRPILIVVLGATDAGEEVRKIVDWISTTY